MPKQVTRPSSATALIINSCNESRLKRGTLPANISKAFTSALTQRGMPKTDPELPLSLRRDYWAIVAADRNGEDIGSQDPPNLLLSTQEYIADYLAHLNLANTPPIPKSKPKSQEIESKVHRYEELESRRMLSNQSSEMEILRIQCEKKTKTLKAEVEKLKSELVDSKHEREVTAQRLAAQESSQKQKDQADATEIAELKRQLEQCRSDVAISKATDSEEIDRLKEQVRRSDTQLTEKRNEATSLRQQLRESNQESDENRDKADHLRQQLEDSNERLWALQTESIRGKNQLEQEIQDLSQESVSNRAENEAQMAILQEQIFVNGVESLEAKAAAKGMQEELQKLEETTATEVARLRTENRRLVARKHLHAFREQVQLSVRERKGEQLRVEIRGIYERNEQLLEQQKSAQERLEDCQVSRNICKSCQ